MLRLGCCLPPPIKISSYAPAQTDDNVTRNRNGKRCSKQLNTSGIKGSNCATLTFDKLGMHINFTIQVIFTNPRYRKVNGD